MGCATARWFVPPSPPRRNPGVLYLYSIIFILSHEIVVSLYVVSSHFIYGLGDFLMMLLELY